MNSKDQCLNNATLFALSGGQVVLVAVVVLSWLGVGFALVAGFCFLLASCLLLAACWFCLPLLLTYWFRLLQFAADLSLFAGPARRWLARVRWPCYLLAAECWLLVGVDNGPCVPSQVLGCLGYSMEPNDKYITVGRTAYCDIFICDTYVSDREFRIPAETFPSSIHAEAKGRAPHAVAYKRRASHAVAWNPCVA